MNLLALPRRVPFAAAARAGGWLLAGITALTLAACDQQRLSELQPGVATEADVRMKLGEPEAVWAGPEGGRILEYNRQPFGKVNYHITIDASGRMVAQAQVLNAGNFARVQPGMRMEDVRRLLGKPASVTPYELKREVTYEWRYIEPPNQEMVFQVDFDDASYTVKRSASLPDPNTAESRAGR